MKKLNDELNLNLNLKKTKVREVRGPIIAWGAAGAAVVICAVFVSLFFVRRNCILNVKSCELSAEEILHFENVMDSAGYERRNTIHPLPYKMQYKTNAPELEIKAGAAILINADTGDIIFEKNADELIPPASMTKLFLMYTVFKKIDEGKASLDDVVPIDERSWASRMPPSSSLMFLGKGQVVTLRELLLGLAVCSGNDASHAVAFYLFDDMDSFLNEVNSTIKKAGLEKTRIVEPSGYSEFNVTTAREMAAFSRIYINEYPDSLKLFHSVKKFVYPLEKNLLPEFKNREAQDFSRGIPDAIWTPVVQRATNTMLKTLEGCDGLKTGHIKESGYNIALTCKRGGERYISVTMKGPGNSMAEGDKFRVSDGTALQEFAFNNFYESDEYETRFDVALLGAKKNCVRLSAPYDVKTVFPKSMYEEGRVRRCNVDCRIEKPDCIYGTVECGKQYGKMVFSYSGQVLMEVPLVAMSEVGQANVFARGLDYLVYRSVGGEVTARIF